MQYMNNTEMLYIACRSIPDPMPLLYAVMQFSPHEITQCNLLGSVEIPTLVEMYCTVHSLVYFITSYLNESMEDKTPPVT